MNPEQRFYVWMTTVISISFVTLCIGGCHESYVTEHEAIKAGLVQKRMDGTTIWSKP